MASWPSRTWTPTERVTAGMMNSLRDQLNELHGYIPVSGNILFPATQAPSSNVNMLDDYEEGIWSPTIGGTGGATGQSYAVSGGVYTKIGRVVICNYELALNVKGTWVGTGVFIFNLPFASVSSLSGGGTNPFTHFIRFANMATNWISMYSSVVLGQAFATVSGQQAAGPNSGAVGLQAADISASTGMSGTIIYITP